MNCVLTQHQNQVWILGPPRIKAERCCLCCVVLENPSLSPRVLIFSLPHNCHVNGEHGDGFCKACATFSMNSTMKNPTEKSLIIFDKNKYGMSTESLYCLTVNISLSFTTFCDYFSFSRYAFLSDLPDVEVDFYSLLFELFTIRKSDRSNRNEMQFLKNCCNLNITGKEY